MQNEIEATYHHLEISQNYGYHFKGSHNKDYSIWGSILGSPYFGEVPFGMRV